MKYMTIVLMIFCYNLYAYEQLSVEKIRTIKEAELAGKFEVSIEEFYLELNDRTNTSIKRIMKSKKGSKDKIKELIHILRAFQGESRTYWNHNYDLVSKKNLLSDDISRDLLLKFRSVWLVRENVVLDDIYENINQILEDG